MLLRKTFLYQSPFSGRSALFLIRTIEKGPNICMYNAQWYCHGTCVLLNPDFKSLGNRNSLWVPEIHSVKNIIFRDILIKRNLDLKFRCQCEREKKNPNKNQRNKQKNPHDLFSPEYPALNDRMG